MAVGPFALTTRDDVKEYLSITNATEDAFLDRLIDAATAKIENFTTRKLAKRSYTHEFNGTGTQHLPLREFPIVTVAEVNIDARRLFNSGTVIQATFIVTSPEEGIISFGSATGAATISTSIFPRGTKVIRVIYEAGFDPIPDDLAFATNKLVAMEFSRAREGADGISSESALGRSISWVDGLPLNIQQDLLQFRRAM